MKIKRKNRFLTFCTSFVPGATELYIGFMKMGASLLTVFGALVMLAIFTRTDIFMFPIFGFWLYTFFHGNNLAGLTQEELESVEDKFLFRIDELEIGKIHMKSYKNWIAGGLIVIGAILLWNTGMDMLARFAPDHIRNMIWIVEDCIGRVVIGLFVIVWGVRMISGKKKEIYIEEGNGQVNDEETDN